MGVGLTFCILWSGAANNHRSYKYRLIFKLKTKMEKKPKPRNFHKMLLANRCGYLKQNVL